MSSSSFCDGNWQAYKAFIDGQDGFPTWLSNSNSNKYGGSDGVYNGSTSSVANGTSLLGEWVQIVLPYGLSLISHQLSSENSYYLCSYLSAYFTLYCLLSLSYDNILPIKRRRPKPLKVFSYSRPK
jgi:hypothetical protein